MGQFRGRSLSSFLAFFVLGCDLNTPEEAPRNNPWDPKNPDAVPEVISVDTQVGEGFTNSSDIELFLKFKAASQMRISEVAGNDDGPGGSWMKADTAFNIQLSEGADGPAVLPSKLARKTSE